MATTIVSYGMGVDSTAMLVGMHARGERPDLVLFADTGDEKPETYAYLATINAWLERVGFPTVTVVKNPRPLSGDKSLSESCLRLGTLPALAYGQHQCSLVWKRDPQIAFVKGAKNLMINGQLVEGHSGWAPAAQAWARDELVTFCIGYDAGPRDSCRSYKAEGKASPGFTNRFPLVEWGWDRERCMQEIAAAGLPVPMKSACFHCPASKKSEIDWLAAKHPQLADRAIALETKAIAKGLKRTKGLGRRFAWSVHINHQKNAEGGITA
jgi:hypothetical protein